MKILNFIGLVILILGIFATAYMIYGIVQIHQESTFELKTLKTLNQQFQPIEGTNYLIS